MFFGLMPELMSFFFLSQLKASISIMFQRTIRGAPRISNHCPSFVNGHGFRLSLEVLPAPNGEATRGWVIGKDAAGYFGTKDLDDERRFPLEDGKWSCFAAARGATAPTSSVANVAKVDSAIEKGCSLSFVPPYLVAFPLSQQGGPSTTGARTEYKRTIVDM